MARRWRGVLLVEGAPTDERPVARLIEPPVAWRDLPRDFGAIFEDGSWGHENAVVVGTIETLERRDGGVIWGEGNILDDDVDADRFANMLAQGALRGVSVDLTAGTVEYEVVDENGDPMGDDVDVDEVIWEPDFAGYIIEKWVGAEIGSVAACRTPAFADAVIELVDETATVAEPEAAAATRERAAFAVIGDTGLPITEREAAWDGPGSSGRVFDMCTSEGADDFDPACASRAFLWRDSDMDDTARGAYSLGFADVINGQLQIVPRGVFAVAGVLQGARGGADIPEEDQDRIKGKVNTMYARMREKFDDDSLTPPWEEASADSVAAAGRTPLAVMLGGRAVRASGAAAGHAVVQASVAWDDGPPAGWFERLDLPGPTPFTITDDGECFGHIKLDGQCHTGFVGGALSRCVTVGPSPTSYALFHSSGQVRCDDGSRVPVGVLTMDTTHAPAGQPGRRPQAQAVLAHYEHSGLQAAHLRAFDDQWGTQVHGALAAGVTVDAVRRAMAARPSGDWRDYGDGLDLLAVLAVNVPGYPVVREVEDGSTLVLQAAMPVPDDVPAAAADAGEHVCSCGRAHAAGNGDRYAALRRHARARVAATDRAMSTSR